jgi:hypothetical protein
MVSTTILREEEVEKEPSLSDVLINAMDRGIEDIQKGKFKITIL